MRPLRLMMAVICTLVLATGCKPLGNLTPAPNRSTTTPLVNDGKVVFLVIRTNMVAGRSPAKLVPVTRASAYRVAAAIPALHIVENSAEGDDGLAVYTYTFDSTGGDWNRLVSSVRRTSSATDSLDLPDDSILGWESGHFIATASPDPSLPGSTIARQYRIRIHQSPYGYTGSYRFVETVDASSSNLLLSETDYDQVADADGQPVSYHIVTRADQTSSGGAEEETGSIDATSQYRETTTYDATRQLSLTDGQVSSSTGWVVPYHLERQAITGVAEGTAKLPDALQLRTRYTPSWRLASGEIRSASGELLGTVVLGSKDRLAIILPDGTRLPEPI